MNKKSNEPYIPFANLVYCGAKARSTSKPCRGSAMKNGRCRLHGGLSTGPKNPPIKHGMYTKKVLAERKSFNLFIREVNDVLGEMV
jgi:hypothetical protein